MRDTTKRLSDILQSTTGLRLKPFVEQRLKTVYPNFSYRHLNGKIHVKDYIAISIATGVSLDELITNDPMYGDLVKELRATYKNAPKPELVNKIPTPSPREETAEDDIVFVDYSEEEKDDSPKSIQEEVDVPFVELDMPHSE